MVMGSITNAERVAHSLLPLDSYQLASSVAWRFRRFRDEIGRVLTVRCFVGCNQHEITMMTRPFVKRQEKSNEVIERRSEESDAERMGEGGGEVRGRGFQEEEGDGEKEGEGRKKRHGSRRKSRRPRRRKGRRRYC